MASPNAAATTTKKPLYKSLYVQVIAAIVIGVALGHFWPQTGEAMKPLGDGFIKLIKMMIAPCRRRSKSEPPCRSNIEPGVEADFVPAARQTAR